MKRGNALKVIFMGAVLFAASLILSRALDKFEYDNFRTKYLHAGWGTAASMFLLLFGIYKFVQTKISD